MSGCTRYQVLLLVVSLTTLAHAQKHELAVNLGADFASSAKISNISTSFAAEGSYAQRIVGSRLIALYGELPVGGGLEKTANVVVGRSGGLPNIDVKFSSFFFTPGLKLKINWHRLSPYLASGVGLAHFSQSNGSKTTWSTSFGGGVDFNILPVVGLRAQVRDYFSGIPQFGLANGSQHNVFVTGGVVLRF